jgi:hypothetical protein
MRRFCQIKVLPCIFLYLEDDSRVSSILEYDNPLLPMSLKMVLHSYVEENWLSGVGILRKVNASDTENIADCWKECCSIILTRQGLLNSPMLLKMVLCCPLWWCPFKLKRKVGGLQFISTDYWSLALTPFRISWTIQGPFAWFKSLVIEVCIRS